MVQQNSAVGAVEPGPWTIFLLLRAALPYKRAAVAIGFCRGFKQFVQIFTCNSLLNNYVTNFCLNLRLLRY